MMLEMMIIVMVFMLGWRCDGIHDSGGSVYVGGGAVGGDGDGVDVGGGCGGDGFGGDGDQGVNAGLFLSGWIFSLSL